LAGVLGHEIGHVAARHAAARITRAAPFAAVTGLGAAVTGIVSPTLGDVVGGIGGLATGLVLAPYSRGQEHEADRVGQDLAAAAGKVQNAGEAVGAVAPDRDAIMLLQTAGNGDDPDAALGAFEEKAGGDLRSRAEHLKLGGLPAVRTTAVARTRDGPLALDLTWVAHANRVYRITGATPAGRATIYRP